MTKTVNIYINDLMHIQVNKTNNHIYIYIITHYTIIYIYYFSYLIIYIFHPIITLFVLFISAHFKIFVY